MVPPEVEVDARYVNFTISGQPPDARRTLVY
jgi:hypothetical protein